MTTIAVAISMVAVDAWISESQSISISST